MQNIENLIKYSSLSSQHEIFNLSLIETDSNNNTNNVFAFDTQFPMKQNLSSKNSSITWKSTSLLNNELL